MAHTQPTDVGVRGLFRRAQSPTPTDHDFLRGKLARYVIDGVASPVPPGQTVAETTQFAHDSSDHMAMFLYASPQPEHIQELADAWNLHPVLVDDLLHAGQRPKLERYGDTFFMVARAARYVAGAKEIEFGEFHVLLRPGAVAVICQDDGWISSPDTTTHPPDAVDFGERERALLADRSLLKLGPVAVVNMLLDTIVDGYDPVIRGFTEEKEEIERQVFSGDSSVTERIYLLSREVIELQQAISSLTDAVDLLRSGAGSRDISAELLTRLDGVADHLLRVTGKVSMLRQALTEILTVDSTLVNQRQNEDMKRISGWAAILFTPSLIGGIYGMNFELMPELSWALGYQFALILMLVLTVVLYLVFKRSRWI